MERLEAALEKARQDRRVVHSVPDPTSEITEPRETAKAPVPIPDIWETIKSVSISPRVARKNRITALVRGKSSGPFDLLRSRALRTMTENKWTTLAITSPNKTCGKTTVCTNLALSLSRQSDLKIVVLDLDRRRPALHKIISSSAENSLHEVLRGLHPVDSAFVRLAPNLVFGLNASPAKDPSELLQSKLALQKLKEIRELFEPDLMLFDLPPMLVGDENVGFLPNVDCGLLVAAADSTTKNQLDVCERELSELTNVLGIVLNKCRHSDPDSSSDYDYY
jgi:protein-tyrosine kinase